MKKQSSYKNTSDIILYQTEDGQTRIEVQFKGETVWLSLNQIADLFQRDKSVISRHIHNVFAEGELLSDSTVAKYATVQTEGKRDVSRDIDFYNLDLALFLMSLQWKRRRENTPYFSPGRKNSRNKQILIR